MCVNLPPSFDHGWWECGDKAAKSGKDRWVAGMGGEGSMKGLGGQTTGDCERQRGSCYIDFCEREQFTKIRFHVQKISIDCFVFFLSPSLANCPL